MPVHFEASDTRVLAGMGKQLRSQIGSGRTRTHAGSRDRNHSSSTSHVENTHARFHACVANQARSRLGGHHF
ncbi:MAG TPA: hypothetical protein VEI49_06315 [Terriglobales bacterium]|nr:hypothetical protein [Terriglobales bacterium]